VNVIRLYNIKPKEKLGRVFLIEERVLKSYIIAKNLEIIQGDALRITFPEFNKCVSNLPYVISSPITFKLLKHDFEKAILTYQKEFAERLIAKPGEKNYSRISVACHYYASVRILEILPPRVFYPKPKVASAIVEIVKKEKPFNVDEERYFALVRDLFSHKKKTVRKALLSSKRIELAKSLPSNILEKRVFKLDPEEIAEMLEYEN